MNLLLFFLKYDILITFLNTLSASGLKILVIFLFPFFVMSKSTFRLFNKYLHLLVHSLVSSKKIASLFSVKIFYSRSSFRA